MGQKSRLKKLRRTQVQQSKPLHSGPEALREFGFEITLEPLRNEDIPPEIRDEKPSLFQQCQVDPAGMIPRLEKLVDQYPGTASLKNWLSVDPRKLRSTLRFDYQALPAGAPLEIAP